MKSHKESPKKAIGHPQTAARQLRTLPDLSGAATNPLSILDTLEKNEKTHFLSWLVDKP